MKIIFSLFCLLSLLVVSCAPPPQQVPLQPPLTTSGSLTLYLQPLPQESHRLNMVVSRIVAHRKDGAELVVADGIPKIEADQLIGRQKLLATTTLAPGAFKGVSITIQSATLLGEEGEMSLSVPAEPVFVEEDFIIEKGRATTLFLTLLPERLVTDGVRLTPRLTLTKPEGVLISLKGFVSNTAANSLTIFNKTGPTAAGEVATGAQPRGLALDQSRELLYVALSGENAIEVVEVNNADIFGKVVLRPGDDPTEISLVRDGALLVSVNPGSHTASIIDTSSLTEVDRVRFKSTPNYIFPAATGARAFVLLPETNSISRLDLSSRQASVLTINLDETPLRGIASRDGNSLYLLTSFSSNLLVLDQESLSVTSRIYLGGGSQDIIEEENGLLYVVKKFGEVVIVDPRVGAIIDSFPVEKGARFLTLDTDQTVLFMIYPQTGIVRKVDLISKKTLGVLETGTSPYAVVVMGEK